MTRDTTYLVRRFYFDESHPDNRKVVARGLTLAQALEHCSDPSSADRERVGGVVAWFDGYETES